MHLSSFTSSFRHKKWKNWVKYKTRGSPKTHLVIHVLCVQVSFWEKAIYPYSHIKMMSSESRPNLISGPHKTRGSAHWACIAHLTIEWYWSKFQREIIITLKNSSHLGMEGGAVGHNFERDTPRDHLCQVWLHLAKLFQRRRFFYH